MKSIFSIILTLSILFSSFPSEIFHHHHDEEKDVCHLEHNSEDFSCCEHFDHGKLPDDPHIHKGFIDCDLCKFFSKDNRKWIKPSIYEITFIQNIENNSISFNQAEFQAYNSLIFLRGPPTII